MRGRSGGALPSSVLGGMLRDHYQLSRKAEGRIWASHAGVKTAAGEVVPVAGIEPATP